MSKKYEVKMVAPLTTIVEAESEKEAIDKAEAVLWHSVNNSDMYFNRALTSIAEIVHKPLAGRD